MVATVHKAQERCAHFSREPCTVIVQAPDYLHIGEAAYFVWAYSPNGECSARRHSAGQRHTTSALTTAQLLLM